MLLVNLDLKIRLNIVKEVDTGSNFLSRFVMNMAFDTKSFDVCKKNLFDVFYLDSCETMVVVLIERLEVDVFNALILTSVNLMLKRFVILASS